jgi:hypothetical protein
MPPAFVLSQDQTLRLNSTQSSPERPNQASHQQEQIHRIQLAYPSSQHPQLPRSARNQDAQSDAQIGSYARTLSGPSVPSKTSQTAACASLPFHNVQEPGFSPSRRRQNGRGKSPCPTLFLSEETGGGVALSGGGVIGATFSDGKPWIYKNDIRRFRKSLPSIC